MSIIQSTAAASLLETFASRRSVRRLQPGVFSPGLIDDLVEAAGRVPSAFDAQPWRIIVLRERHAAFWDLIDELITRRLDGDRRDRYRARAEGMRSGGMTLLIFEDVALIDRRDNVTVDEARDQASQSLGMLQLTLWLTLSAHGLVTSLQHWEWLMDDVALAFVGLPDSGFRLVTFMPVGSAVESPVPHPSRPSRVSLEDVRRNPDDAVSKLSAECKW